MKWICAVIVCAGAGLCFAQAGNMFQGEVQGPATDRGPLWVELEAGAAGGGPHRAFVSPDGRFSISDVPAGNYRVRILDASGNELAAQAITVGLGVPTLVTLPPAAPERPSGATISVARLRHHPPKRAWQSLLKAQHLSEKGRHEAAAAALEKAIALDSEFIEAHANLGVEYTRLGQYGRAAAEFRKAIALDPASAPFQSNLAYTLLRQGEFAEAEQWARSAVQMDSANPKGHYVLGCILVVHPASRDAGISHLEVAARTYPSAHHTLAAIYQEMGKKDLAERERLLDPGGGTTPVASARKP